ncbi:RadC family protein [Veillonella magna]|uniref:RadC family protein n=1 Tax=Veillonella magna TaxID=464322 RepID=UPI0003F7CBF5|nr:DNA repair protein RadC [Veillonella magna]MBD8975943.1 JAB domain-containing protein [Veillonella magna]
MLRIQELRPFQRPREKFFAHGAAVMTTEELIAILLRTGHRGKSAIDIAHDIVASLPEGETGLQTISVEELCQIKGIGRDKAVTLCAAIELGRRLTALHAKQEYSDFSSPEAVADYVMEQLRHEPSEHVCVAYLTCKNKLIAVETISTGGLTASYAEQRSVFRGAVRANAASIILIHNHPSGEATASPQDVRITKEFEKAGQIMGIPVLDHIIIGDGEYVSLAKEGLL